MIISVVVGFVPSGFNMFLNSILTKLEDACSVAGTNPKSFARDTTFFLICAESKNSSEAAMFVFTPLICVAYANVSIRTDIVEPSKS